MVQSVCLVLYGVVLNFVCPLLFSSYIFFPKFFFFFLQNIGILAKWVRKYKEILESRMGRMREPMESMRYLIVKPVNDEVTEKQICETCFKNYPIESVHFARDMLGQVYNFIQFKILAFSTQFAYKRTR